MNRDDHISTEEIAAFVGGDMGAEQARAIEAHVESCAECAAAVAGARAFIRDLDDAWNRERLRAMGVAHPSPAEIEALWMGEPDGYDLAAIRRHVEDCVPCGKQLQRLEEGFAALMDADPLTNPGWAAVTRRKFAAGIEMAVEATTGAFTTAAGLVRDVMTPQAHVRLAPATAVAMGADSEEAPNRGSLWHDATFQTDEVSGEITGSTDEATGRGIITVVVHKSGGYVATPPIVDLVNDKGRVVATQSTLDMGDRYSVSFSNLDQGRYLVGIREPGE